MVVVVLPSLKFLPQVVQRDEFVQVKEFVAQSTVERFDQPIIGRLAGARVIELDAAPVCPVVQRPRREFRSVIHGDCLGPAAKNGRAVQCQPDTPAISPKVGLWAHALATPLINDGQDANAASV